LAERVDELEATLEQKTSVSMHSKLKINDSKMS